MNTHTAQGPSSAIRFTNGGDYVTEAMAGRQQSSAYALTQAA